MSEEYDAGDGAFGGVDAASGRPDATPSGRIAKAERYRVEFTPTTAVCPETVSLAPAILRALTAVDMGYDGVRVRVTERYQHADRLNAVLADLERITHERGSVPAVADLGDDELDPLGPSPSGP